MKIGLMAGVGLMLPRSVFGETPPPPQGSNPPNILKHRPTVADRRAAAQNMRQMGLLPGAAGATNIVNIPDLPH